MQAGDAGLLMQMLHLSSMPGMPNMVTYNCFMTVRVVLLPFIINKELISRILSFEQHNYSTHFSVNKKKTFHIYIYIKCILFKKGFY